MDSKSVNKAIKQIIVPLLKTQGFTHFTQRTGWRYKEKQIDVVNFQSFNSYHGERLGCTTFSFAVNLGVYFRYIPEQYPGLKVKNNLEIPEEYRCHFRRGLQRKLVQDQCKVKNICTLVQMAKMLI